MGFESDPVKAWKVAQSKDGADEVESDDESVATTGSGSGPDFGYLLNMPILNLTKEKKDELLKQKDAKVRLRAVLPAVHVSNTLLVSLFVHDLV